MALSWVGSGDSEDILFDGNNADLTWDSGIASGDLSVIFVSWFEGSGLNIAVTTPTGFTAPAGNQLVISGSGSSEGRVAIFYKQHTGTESGTINVAFTGTATELFATVMLMTLRGSSALTFSSVTAGTAANGTTCTSAAVTASSTQGIIIGMGTGDPTTMTTPSGMTAGVVGLQNTNTGRVFFQTGATSGSKSSTLGTSRENGAITILVDGAAASGGTNTTKVMTETFDPIDAALDPVQRVRQLSDTTAFADPSVFWLRRYRLMGDAITIIDEAVKTLVFGSGVFTKVMTDTVDAVDGFFTYLRRRRESSEIITLGEGSTFRQFLITASEDVELADTLAKVLRYRRVLDEGLTIIDGFTKTIAGAGITYIKVLSDAITVIDNAGNRWTLRYSRLSEAIGLSDEVLEAIRRVRQLSDDLVFEEGTITIRRFVRAPLDEIIVSDESISAFFQDQLSPVAFTFGASGPPFRFGGN
jgi:hypothetical protein